MRFFDLRPHARLQRHLGPYIDGSLDAGRAASLQQHIVGCSACRAQVNQLRGLRAALQSLPEPPAPRSFRLTTAMLAEAAPTPAPSPQRSQVPPWARTGTRVVGSLAAAALAVLVVVDLAPGSGSSSEDTLSMAASAVDDSSAGSAAPESAGSHLAPEGTPASADAGSASGDDATAADDERSSKDAPAYDATALQAPAAAADGGEVSLLRIAQIVVGGIAVVAIAASFLVPVARRKEHP